MTTNCDNQGRITSTGIVWNKRMQANSKKKSSVEAARLGIPIFGSNFWDPHCKRNSDFIFDSKDSGWNLFLKF